MKRLSLILLLLVLSIGGLSAQTVGKVVSGTIIAGDDNSPIAGATIRAKNTKGKGTISDINGKFRLLLPDNEDAVIVSFVGYASREITAGKELRIVLKPEAEALKEVMVVAYGTATKQQFTGSAVTVSGDKLKLKSMNVTKALEGEVPGVQVISTSGQPGTSAQIVVRGIGSTNSFTSPLYVVDGVPYGNSMNGIDPADIQSISVLKDASATALYGSRAANGVVLISTKRGADGAIRVNAEVKYGINKRTLPLHDVITSPEEYMELSYQALSNKYNYLKTTRPKGLENATINELLFTPGIGIIPEYNIWTVPENQALIDPQTGKFNPNAKRIYTPENWADHVFRTGKRTEANVNMSGGNTKLSFFTSLGFLSDEGYYINSGFNRFNLRNNLTANVTDNFRNTFNVAYSRTEMDNPGQENNTNNGFAFVGNMPPIYPVFRHRLVKDKDGEAGSIIMDTKLPGRPVYDYGEYKSGSRGFFGLINPAGSVQLDQQNTVTNNVSSNYTGELSFLDHFKFSVNAGYQVNGTERNILANPYYGDSKGTGSLERNHWGSTNLTFNQILSWQNKFGLHNWDAFVAHESYSYKYREDYVRKSGSVQGNVPQLSDFVKMEEIDGYDFGYNLESYFGQLRYDYNNRYFISASLRTDGSSRFADGHRWGVFGSLGAAWMVSNEEFMKSQNVFDMLKLKASWGRIGNQDIDMGFGDVPNYFTYLDFYKMSNVNDKPIFTFNNKGNPNLTWEVSNSYNIGLESRLWDALTLNIDWFSRTVSQMLFRKDVNPSVGYVATPVNDGKLRNTGVEVDLRWDIYKKSDWNIAARLNMAHYSNVIVQMPKAPTGAEKAFQVKGSYGWARGHSLYDHYGYTYKGVDPTNGKPLFKAYRKPELLPDGSTKKDKAGNIVYSYLADYEDFVSNKKGNISEYEETTVNRTADAVKEYTGHTALPTLTGGFGFDIGYKGLTLNTSFAFGLGGYAYDYTYANLMNSDEVGKHNYHVDIRKAWKPVAEGQKPAVTDVPMLSSGVIPYTSAKDTSNRFLTSRSYLTISNVRLSYQLPQSVTSKLNLKNLGFYISGDNLYSFTARRGFFSGTTLSGGSDHIEGTSVRPTQRYLPVATFTAGIQVGI